MLTERELAKAIAHLIIDQFPNSAFRSECKRAAHQIILMLEQENMLTNIRVPTESEKADYALMDHGYDPATIRKALEEQGFTISAMLKEHDGPTDELYAGLGNSEVKLGEVTFKAPIFTTSTKQQHDMIDVSGRE